MGKKKKVTNKKKHPKKIIVADESKKRIEPEEFAKMLGAEIVSKDDPLYIKYKQVFPSLGLK